MANNTRTSVKLNLNRSDDYLTKVLASLDTIFDLYDESGLETTVIIETVFYCMKASIEFDNIEPIQIYRELLRKNEVPYLGRYDQHLFHLASIYISVNACKESLAQFKLWETKN